jgi:hypothetical protein
MDLFLLHLLVLVWISVAVGRKVRPARSAVRVPIVLGLAAGWLLLLTHWAATSRVPPPFHPIHFEERRAATSAPVPAAMPGCIFTADLLSAIDTPGCKVTGLLAATGPWPEWSLPRIRGSSDPIVRLRIPALPSSSHLRLSFSVRLHRRNRAGLTVWLNARPVRQFRLDDATSWLDASVDLKTRPGENVVELRDTPLHNEPDWKDYLERYPDVQRFLVDHNIPLEAGAKSHYEAAGRQEGRTTRILETVPAESDSYYFLFRQLRVDGFQSP